MRFDRDKTVRRLRAFIQAAEASVQSITPEDAARLVGEAGSVLDKGKRTEDAMRLVVEALRKAERDTWVHVIDWYSEAVVYETPDRDAYIHMRDFAIDADTEVKLGEPTAVEKVYREIEVQQSSTESDGGGCVLDLHVAQESAGDQSPNITIKIIRPGQGSSGLWTAEVLKRDGPSVFPAGTHMHIDHATATEENERPERSIQTLAAVTTEAAHWDEAGPDGPGLYAAARVSERFLPIIKDFVGDIGVSLRAYIEKTGETITKLLPSPLTTIDFVTVPGAGGKVLAALESARNTSPTAAAADPDTEENTKIMKELQQAIESLTAKVDALVTANSALSAKVDAAESRTFASDARAAAREAVASADLPEPAKVRAVESLVTMAKATESGDVDQAAMRKDAEAVISTESAYIRSISGGGRPDGNGGAPPADTNTDEAATESLVAVYMSQGMTEAEAKIAAA